MRTSSRIAGVLAGLSLALGGVSLAAPAVHAAPADVSACINQVERELKGGEAPASVRASCFLAVTGAQDECVSGLTEGAGVTKGTAEAACKVGAE
ncbi:hypothetical protein M8Z33_11525 [Streptomyces sp. ZAF1911]|uniref:hypothetical protein n=1 Tax=unclassified Streptomyces TaxID=2593676 RepID=UPI00237A2854|nr:hypothetical protein [Streptomyces sp. ZAF1911]MDD9377295.1 hypothetical protein [Streptomyces sp. ZAF1911]